MSVGPEVPRTMRAGFAREQMTRRLRRLEPRAFARCTRSRAYVARRRQAGGRLRRPPITWSLKRPEVSRDAVRTRSVLTASGIGGPALNERRLRRRSNYGSAATRSAPFSPAPGGHLASNRVGRRRRVSRRDRSDADTIPSSGRRWRPGSRSAKRPPTGRVDGRGVDRQSGDHRLDHPPVELGEEVGEIGNRPVVEAGRLQ